jgi:nucleoside-diphosphate-sugar epimerase
MILVTGGTGLIGSHLLFQLLQNSTEHLRAIRRQGSNLENVLSVFKLYDPERAHLLFENIEWVEADLLDIPFLSDAFKGISKVYHCAGFISYDVRDNKTMRRINIEGTANIVNLCLHNGIKKLCHVSSISAIGSTLNGKPITEETVWNPELAHSNYAWSKYGGEMEVWRGTQEGLNAVIVNPGVVIGPGFWKSGSGLLFTKVANGLKYTPILTTGFVDVFDVVKPMIALMESNHQKERYILVSESLPFNSVLNKIADALDKQPPKKTLTSWMVFMGWAVQSIGHTLFNTKKTISYDSIKGVFSKSIYSNNKLIDALNYSFKPIGKSITDTAAHY